MINERLSAQLLSGSSATTALDVAERLLAIQGQDARGARLAIRARTVGLRSVDVDRAMTADRALVTTWLNRGTLHVVRSEDYWWLHPLTNPALHTGNARRLSQEGVSPSAADRGVEVVERSLSAEGPLTRRQLRERVAAAGVRVEGQALVHILVLASLRGLVVRGPVIAGEQAYALTRDWLGAPPPAVDHEVALARLGRRYLAGHGPATERDLSQVGRHHDHRRAARLRHDRREHRAARRRPDRSCRASQALSGCPTPTTGSLRPAPTGMGVTGARPGWPPECRHRKRNLSPGRPGAWQGHWHLASPRAGRSS